jgi:aminoglycoside phosphotransferase (APT) family kinase protein
VSAAGTSGLDARQLHALADYLRQHVGTLPGPLQARPLTGGQSNPTVLVSSGDRRWVVRRKPAGTLLASAHAIDREFRVMRALQASAVPVPEVHAYCEDPERIGVPFYVMEHVQGRVFTDPALPGLTAAQRGRVYQAQNATLAAIHSVDVQALDLADYGRPQGFLRRQLQRWTTQYRASQTEEIVAMESLIAWLQAHLPEGDDPCLVHGDFRIDNLLFHPEREEVLAVIDWELSTLGHGLVDFAYHAMAWRVTAQEFRGMRGEDLAALGIPDEATYLRAYCAKRGVAEPTPQQWTFYLAFNMFRMAAILQGILHRALNGNAAAADALDNGRRARLMADAGWRLVGDA